MKIVIHLLRAFRHYVQSTHVHPFDNIHEFIFEKRSIKMTFYSSPEELGYYSALPNYAEPQYVLCHIEEKDDDKLKYEMCFSFNSKEMTFLELFDITHYLSDNLLKETHEKDISSIEAQLRNTVLL